MVDFTIAQPSNVTTFAQQIAYIDSLTDVGFGGMIGVFMLIIIFSVLFLMMKSFRTESVFGISAFITSILGILIRVLFPISDNVLYISIILALIGILLMKIEHNSQSG